MLSDKTFATMLLHLLLPLIDMQHDHVFQKVEPSGPGWGEQGGGSRVGGGGGGVTS